MNDSHPLSFWRMQEGEKSELAILADWRFSPAKQRSFVLAAAELWPSANWGERVSLDVRGM
jgi:hypothetical protein